MPRYIDRNTGDEVEIVCLPDHARAVVKRAGAPDALISQQFMNANYDIVTPQTIELVGEGSIGTGAEAG